ncbi:MAG: hypothetical protein GC160_20490 [Acidobacteria bacterium]|nr:hypothetical protein [Acidobacteriota bacterium]
MANPAHNRRYLLILTAAATAILVVGSLLRPEKRAEAELSPAASAPAEVPFLQRMTLRRSVEDIADYFSDLARRLEPHVVRLEKAQMSAVVWDGGMLATAADGRHFLDQDRALRPPQRSWRVWPERVAPQLPTALLETSEEDPPRAPPRYAAGFFTAGGWAVAAWRNAGGDLDYLAGLYLGSSRRPCQGVQATVLRTNLGLREEMIGGGVFDVDGALMGLIVWCDGKVEAIDVSTVERTFEPPQIVSERVLARYGLRAEQLTERGVKAFGVDYGVQVTEVWVGWEAYQAGLRPGDVIIAVDGDPATAVTDLEPLTLPVARENFDLAVVRNGQKRQVRLNARTEGQAPFGPAGVGWSQAPAGFRIESVEAGSPAATADLRPGDRLLRIGADRPETIAEINKALLEASAKKPAFVVVQRGRRVWGAFLG